MDYMDILLKVLLPLAGIVLVAWIIRRIIPDTPLTGSGCGGG